MIVCLNGKFVDAKNAKISAFDPGFLYGDAVYETMRTYKGKPWQIDLHLKRLQGSLKIAKIRSPWSMKELAVLVLKLIQKNRYSESRIRLMVSRGVNATKGVVFQPTSVKLPTLFITCYPISLWRPGPVTTGSCVFFHVERSFPEVKTTSIFPLMMARMDADSRGAVDALLVDRDDFIYEGAISNVFVVKNDVLITPDKNILKGTMRDFILKLARKFCPCRIEFRAFTKRDFFSADEVFLTNAPRGIIAIHMVEERKICQTSHAPGPFTSQLKKVFDQYIHERF